jgi:hypothetical protein
MHPCNEELSARYKLSNIDRFANLEATKGLGWVLDIERTVLKQGVIPG